MKSKKMKKKSSSGWFRGKNQDESVRSVLLVPCTPGSELMRKIRDLEAANKQGRESRIRVVERAGRTLVNSLSSNYPWKPRACDDEECFPCSTNITGKYVSCRKPGMAYKITCSLCSSAAYEGETSKCLYVRGKKHLEEFGTGVLTNCMVIHNKKFHQDSKVLNFRMEGLGHFHRPLDRQIDEALRIKNSDAMIIMNSGAEWRQPALPRASFSAPGLERRSKT